MANKKPGLDAAYSLETPDDNIALYADWAKTYDSDFAERMEYLLPYHVVEVLKTSYDGSGPILDVGSGTGLIADALKPHIDVAMDALDISPEMLEVAGQKNLYRNYIIGDLTKMLPIQFTTYDAIVSAGTFTHGHVGPNALDELLRVAKRNALFVLTINKEHFTSKGFASKLEALSDRIFDVTMPEVPIYGNAADKTHADDKALLACFRKI